MPELDAIAAIDDLTADRDRARDAAVALEQELAHAEDTLVAVADVVETLRRTLRILERQGTEPERARGIADALGRLDRVMPR